MRKIIVISILITFFISKGNYANNILPGIEIGFNNLTYPKEMEIVYNYYKQKADKYELPIHTLNKDEIGIYLYDIDNDGQKEILYFLGSREFCNSMGCYFGILKAYKDFSTNNIIYISLSFGNVDNKGVMCYPEIRILKNQTLGKHDLLLRSYGGETIWQWQGQYYN